MGTQKKVTHVGVDCHKNFSRVTARDEHGKVAFRQRLEHGDRQELRKQLRAWPAGLPVVLEGTFGWGWLSDEIQAAGHEPHLASSRKTAAWRQARGLAKSNRIDADLLSDLWPEKQRWWEVWLAPPEVRDQREWLRYRMSLVRTQTALKNRVHATLHRHGIVHGFADLFGVAGMKLLKRLSDPNDATLRDSARRTLAGYLRLLAQVRRQIAEATRELNRQLRRSEEGELWRSLPGVSWVLAYTILAEVGPAGRFKNGRRLCSYALLVPLADDSGDEDDATPLGRHVGHAGRRTLKWALIEAARGAVRKSGFFREIFDRRTDGGKRNKCRGYIAVARELCRVGHSCVKGRRQYREQRPANAGRTARAQTPADQPAMDLLVRECVGPDRPLAAALR
jgi:transposase